MNNFIKIKEVKISKKATSPLTNYVSRLYNTNAVVKSRDIGRDDINR